MKCLNTESTFKMNNRNNNAECLKVDSQSLKVSSLSPNNYKLVGQHDMTLEHKNAES